MTKEMFELDSKVDCLIGQGEHHNIAIHSTDFEKVSGLYNYIRLILDIEVTKFIYGEIFDVVKKDNVGYCQIFIHDSFLQKKDLTNEQLLDLINKYLKDWDKDEM